MLENRTDNNGRAMTRLLVVYVLDFPTRGRRAINYVQPPCRTIETITPGKGNSHRLIQLRVRTVYVQNALSSRVLHALMFFAKPGWAGIVGVAAATAPAAEASAVTGKYSNACVPTYTMPTADYSLMYTYIYMSARRHGYAAIYVHVTHS